MALALMTGLVAPVAAPAHAETVSSQLITKAPVRPGAFAAGPECQTCPTPVAASEIPSKASGGGPRTPTVEHRVPEPATMFIMGSGLFVIGVWVRRRLFR